MFRSAGPPRVVGSILGVLFLLTSSVAASAQISTTGFATGPAALAWEKWQAALQAILSRDTDQAETLFGELLAHDPSAFRVALLADYAVNRGGAGGAVLLFEHDHEADALEPNGRGVAELLEAGREQMNQADDGWYFCQIGRFDVAEANFRALLDADPDPVALLEFTDRVPRRRDILLQLIDNKTVGESVRRILGVLDRGELAIKARVQPLNQAWA